MRDARAPGSTDADARSGRNGLDNLLCAPEKYIQWLHV